MGFNAGGTNVGGVQSIEQGVFTISNVPTTFSNAGGETINVETTVPAGEIWIIKNIGTTNTSLVGTLSHVRLFVYDSTCTNYSKALNYIGTNTDQIVNCSTPLTMTEGCKIRHELITSAWTSGQMICFITYQKVLI